MSNNNIDFLKLLLDLSIGESARSSTRLAPFIIVQSVLIGFTLTAVFNPQSNIYATVLILIPPILGIVIAILHGSTIKTSKYYNHIWSNGARKWIKTIKSGNISISDHNQAQTDFLSKILDYRINSLWVKHDPSDDKETKKRLVVTAYTLDYCLNGVFLSFWLLFLYFILTHKCGFGYLREVSDKIGEVNIINLINTIF